MLSSLERNLIYHNNLYRKGKPVISDQEYDKLLEEYQEKVSPEKYKSFRELLFDKPGKVKLPYTMGSLEKINFDDYKKMEKFLKDNDIKKLFVTEKLDGFSILCKFNDGKLEYAYTRGDGEYGEDKTDIIKRLKCIKELEKEHINGAYRGEVILTNDWHIKNKFANRRNAVVGIFASDTITDDMLTDVKVLFYQNMSCNFDIYDQFYGFFDFSIPCPKYWEIDCEKLPGKQICSKLSNIINDSKDGRAYDCDGLVICSMDWTNEHIKLPEHKFAFKGKDETYRTTVKNITWSLNKSGNIIPTVIFDEILISGCKISQATGFNANYIKENKICIGTEILIKKSHDIIPQICCILHGNDNYVLPDKCDICGGKYIEKGIHLVHPDNDCPEVKFQEMLYFLKNMGIKNFSAATLRKMGVTSFEQLVNFTYR